MKRRVVITGMGTVNPLGNDVKTFWKNLIAGKSGVENIKRFPIENFTTKFAGLVKDFDPSFAGIEIKDVRKLDLFSQYAIYAATEAVKDAGLKEGNYNPERSGTVVGSGIGGIVSFQTEYEKLLTKGPRRVSPFFIPQMISDIAAGHISMKFDLRGPNYATVSACASASHAIINSYNDIVVGNADIMVTGGAEAPIAEVALAGFNNMKALSTRNDAPEKASRPFDIERDGFVMGEGAGILVIEELEHAQKRGARIYAEIVGGGYTADAYHITAPVPDGNGAARSMIMALNGASPEEVDYINAHGTSTPANDKTETVAIKSVFGEHAYKMAVSSTKSMTGHLLGAAGGIEAIALTLTIVNDQIPPTINLENPDPECDLDYTPNKAVKRVVNFGLSNTFGFGGHNATIAMRKYSGD
jgi:3-oxoacyl-[acyl-carrier-protein] synthase II